MDRRNHQDNIPRRRRVAAKKAHRARSVTRTRDAAAALERLHARIAPAPAPTVVKGDRDSAFRMAFLLVRCFLPRDIEFQITRLRAVRLEPRDPLASLLVLL